MFINLWYTVIVYKYKMSQNRHFVYGLKKKRRTNVKKRFLLPLCMAAVISASAVSPVVNAESGDKPCLFLDSGYAGENDMVFVDAVLDGDVKAAAYSISLGFDPSKLEFVSASSELKGGTFYYNAPTDDSVTFVWSGKKDIGMEGKVISMAFKTRGRTAGDSVSIQMGHCIIGSEDMAEIPIDTEGCEINVLQSFKYGDTNCDGVTDFADVVSIKKFRMDSDIYSPDENGLINSDTDKNSIVDERDSENVLDYVFRNTEEGA